MIFDQYLRKYPKWRKWRGLPEPMTPEMGRLMRDAWALLAQNLNTFADQCGKNVNRDYDYLPGQTIKIRRPPRYAVNK